MKLENIRLGHACNSSSTHSILLLKPDHRALDDIDGKEYGWDYWTAASREAKDDWLMCGFRHSLSMAIGTVAADSILKQEFDWSPDDDLHVDHQSWMSVPAASGKVDSSTIHFMRKLRSMVARPEVVIVGGNDNDDEIHPLEPKSVGKVDYKAELGVMEHTRFRVDGDMMTLFSRPTGARMSMSFGPDTEPRTPMLIDVKVTDYCTKGCAFCYQGSTTAGTHADLKEIYKVVDWAKRNEVFEVALGGGEPASHPGIGSIIDRFNMAGMNVNMTTRDFDGVMENEGHFSSLSAVAVSVESVMEMSRWINAWPWRFYVPHSYEAAGGRKGPVLTFQVIDGLVPASKLADMEAICSERGIRITILGYKTTGFGLNVKPRSTGAWLPIWKKKSSWDRGGIKAVDTVAAQALTGDATVVPESMILSEGVWSRYFDCVTRTEGPSSYSPEEMKPWKI